MLVKSIGELFDQLHFYSDVDKNKAGQTKPLYPHPDVKAEVGGGRGKRVELVSSD